MKFVRFKVIGKHASERIFFGEITGKGIRLLTEDFMKKYSPTEIYIPFGEAELLLPVLPSKILAVGANYRSPDFEPPEVPAVFAKLPDTAVPHGAAIESNPETKEVKFEGEMALVIGKTCFRVSEEEAKNCIFGVTCLNDVSAADMKSDDGQWMRAKNFNSFTPFGPCVATDLNYDALKIETRVNGVTKQSSSTSEMIRSAPWLVSFISKTLTLLPGDLISTGTPSGVGILRGGDIIEIELEGVGTLRNIMKKESK